MTRTLAAAQWSPLVGAKQVQRSQIESGVQTITLDKWQDYIDRIYSDEFDNAETLIYRGQADAEWAVRSTLDRLERDYPQKRNLGGGVPRVFGHPPAPREVHLQAFRAAVRGRHGQNAPKLSEDEWWVLARHHGLATPLLDWTLSPGVALFFAFEQEKVLGREGSLVAPEYRSVYVLCWHLVAGEKRTEEGPWVFLPTKDLSPRVQTQSGVFLKMPPGKELVGLIREHFPEETAGNCRHPRPILRKILIPDRGRIECLRFLDRMNINRMTLFPDIDGAAAHINALWSLEFLTPLGWIPERTGQANCW